MTDEVDLVAQEGVAKRKAEAAERRVERKRRKQTDASKRGRSSHNKGHREERETENVLYPFGFVLNVDSGVLTGADFFRPLDDGKVIQHLERKYDADATGFKTLYNHLAQSTLNDCLVVRGAYQKSLYVIPEDRMLLLLREAGYDGFTEATPGYAKWRWRQTKRKRLEVERDG